MSYQYQSNIIIATNKIQTSPFRHAVVYIHTNDETGSLGIILNKQMDQEQAKKWSEAVGWVFPEKIYLGGPVDQYLGYVIHSSDYADTTSIPLTDSVSYTGGKPIAKNISRGTGPNKFLLMTGYCSWSPGQLENEIGNGIWISADFDYDYFFQNMDRDEYWEFSMNLAAKKQTNKLLDIN